MLDVGGMESWSRYWSWIGAEKLRVSYQDQRLRRANERQIIGMSSKDG